MKRRLLPPVSVATCGKPAELVRELRGTLRRLAGDGSIDTTPGRLTPYQRLDEVLVGYADTLRNVLGNTFVGLYPIGSLAIGDFDLTSDVDFAVVTESELSERDVQWVQAAHTTLIAQGAPWVAHLEYSFFTVVELGRPTSPYGPGGRRNDTTDRLLWYVANASPTIERSDHDNSLVTRWTLRHASPSVLGPEPVSFAPDVPATALRDEIRSSMIGWDHLVHADPARFCNRFHQVFLVLNNCRALQDLHEGRITSKRAGMTWAKEHLDTLDFMSVTARLAEHFAQPVGDVQT